MKNLYLYLMAMTALMSIIVTVNVLAMSQVKQNEMMERMQSRIDLISHWTLAIVIREILVTIFKLFIPIIFLSVGAGVAWTWWFSPFSNKKNSVWEATTLTENVIKSPTTTTNSSLQHHHNLRPKRQTNFILD